jgi:hypothetical protein
MSSEASPRKSIKAPASTTSSDWRSYLTNKLQDVQESFNEKKRTKTSQFLKAPEDASSEALASASEDLLSSDIKSKDIQVNIESSDNLYHKMNSILKEIDAEFAENVDFHYQKYKKSKSDEEKRESQSVLSLQDFVYFHVFWRLPHFLFKFPDLAISVIGATRERFVRFSEVLIPLASKQNADKIFKVLSKGKDLLDPSDFKNYILLLKVHFKFCSFSPETKRFHR